MRKRSTKPRIKNAHGEERGTSITKKTAKTPAEMIAKEPRVNFSFSDEKEVNCAAEMFLKNNLVQNLRATENPSKSTSNPQN